MKRDINVIGRSVTQQGQRALPTIISLPPGPAPPRPPAASTSSPWRVRCCGGGEHAPGAPGLRRHAPRGCPVVSCPALARLAPCLLHQSRLLCVGHPVGGIRTQIPAGTRLTKGHPAGACSRHPRWLRRRHQDQRLGPRCRTAEAGPRRHLMVVYLCSADKYRRLTHRLSQEQKGLDERALLTSQRPFHPW
jgi:hypothetical protein